MGIYSTNVSIDDFLYSISHWLEKQHFLIKDSFSNNISFSLKAQSKSGIFLISFDSHIIEISNNVFELSIRLTSHFSRILFSFGIAFNLLLFIYTIYYLNIDINVIKKTSSVLLLTPFYILILLYIILYILFIIINNYSRRLEYVFRQYLIDNTHECTLLHYDSFPFLFSPLNALLYNFSLLVSMLYICYCIGLIYFLLCLISFIIIYSPYLINYLLASRLLSWKIKYISLINSWSLVCFIFIFSNLVLFTATSFNYNAIDIIHANGYFNKSGDIFHKLATLRTDWNHERDNKEIIEDNVELLYSLSRQYDLRYSLYSLKRHKYIKKSVSEYRIGYEIALAYAFMYLIILFLYYYSIKHLLNERINQIYSSGHDKEYQFTKDNNTFNHSKQKRNTSIFIIAHYTFVCILNGVSIYLSLEMLHYIIFSKAAFNNMLTGIFAYASTLYTVTISENYGIVIAKAIMFIFICPFIIILIFNLKRFAYITIRIFMPINNMRMGNKRKGIIDELEYSINTITTKHHISKPTIVIIRTQEQPIKIVYKYLSNKAYILLSDDKIDLFTKSELTAMIIHEIGHIINGVRKVKWLQMISAITMYSNYYLTLCYDFDNEEYYADEFVVHNMKEKGSLIKAIIKCEILGLTKERVKIITILNKLRKTSWIDNIVHSTRFIIEYYYGEYLIDYMHIPTIQRIQKIRQMSVYYDF